MFWPPTCNAALTSAVGEAVNPAVVQKPHRNMALIYVCRRGGEEEDYLRRSLLLFFLRTSITMWIEVRWSSEVKGMFADFRRT